MSAPPAGYLLRKNDFPSGIQTADDVERLAALVNPYLSSLTKLGTGGVNAASNFDGQVLTVPVTTPATDWTPFTPATWTNPGGAYPSFSYRRDAQGLTWLRGRIATLPALTTTLATLPAQAAPGATIRFACDAAGAYGAFEIDSGGLIKQVVGSILGTLDLVASFPNALGCAVGLSCFPLSLRIKDGRRPSGVILLSATDSQQAGVQNSGVGTPPISSGSVQWSYGGQSPGKPNLVSIDNVAGLALGRNYSLSFLVLFA